MLRLPAIFLIEHVQWLPIESQILVFDVVWQLPCLCIEIDFSFCGVTSHDVGDEDVVLVRLGAGRHGHGAGECLGTERRRAR